MSILIKGMEMPKNCLDCPCCDDMGGAYCRPLQKKLGLAFASLYKPDDCPLISVPKHGRLIDADALIKLLDNCMFPSDIVTTRAVSMARNWLIDAPTIIESEREK